MKRMYAGRGCRCVLTVPGCVLTVPASLRPQQLLQVCERIPTIGTQLKILSTVKATMLGAQGKSRLTTGATSAGVFRGYISGCDERPRRAVSLCGCIVSAARLIMTHLVVYLVWLLWCYPSLHVLCSVTITAGWWTMNSLSLDCLMSPLPHPAPRAAPCVDVSTQRSARPPPRHVSRITASCITVPVRDTVLWPCFRRRHDV